MNSARLSCLAFLLAALPASAESLVTALQCGHVFDSLGGKMLGPTIRGAELLQREKDLGSIDAGKLADVVAVAGDPVADVGVMRTISFVMKDGRIYRQNGTAVIDDDAR